LLSAGRTRDGLYQILRGADAASAGDDNAASNSWDLAYAYLQSGQVAYARTQIDRLPSQDRQLLNLELALQTGDATELMTAARALPARFDLIRELAQWWAEGNAEAALSEIRRVSGDSNSWSDIRALAARWAARFNDPRQAWTIFAGLDYKTDLWRSIWMPYFSEVRKLDEFKEFVRQDGLEEYWRTTGHWADTCRPLGDDDFECF
jgi:thioredoxin-like negative regulator of GroEL